MHCSDISASAEVCHLVSFPYDHGITISGVVLFLFCAGSFFALCIGYSVSQGYKEGPDPLPAPHRRGLELTSPWEDGQPQSEVDQALHTWSTSCEQRASGPEFLLWPRDSGSESPQIWRQVLPQ